ncbi:hypothetical protein ABGB17_35280 [Sphaerisporangium sp. B11E5]|uniref:hypothetical protein n=1 Tax=Sphaerisporangium sp. B11E5 TaxID=3153563 RepID=UPI00325EAE5E
MDTVQTVMNIVVVPLLTLVATLVAVDGWRADRRERARSRSGESSSPSLPYTASPQSSTYQAYGQAAPYSPAAPYGQATSYGGHHAPAPAAPPHRPALAWLAPWGVTLLHVPLLWVAWLHIVAWDSLSAAGDVTPQALANMPVSAFFFVLSGGLICLRLARSGDPAHDGRRWLYWTLLAADVTAAAALMVLREQIWNYSILPALAVFLLLTGWSLPRGRQHPRG